MSVRRLFRASTSVPRCALVARVRRVQHVAPTALPAPCAKSYSIEVQASLDGRRMMLPKIHPTPPAVLYGLPTNVVTDCPASAAEKRPPATEMGVPAASLELVVVTYGVTDAGHAAPATKNESC